MHADLKQENILISRKPSEIEFTAKIIDVDHCYKSDTRYNNSAVAGTLEYIPPEMHKLQQENGLITPAIDIYALGVLFAEIMGIFLNEKRRLPVNLTSLNAIAAMYPFTLTDDEYNEAINDLLPNPKAPLQKGLKLAVKKLLEKMTPTEPQHRKSNDEIIHHLNTTYFANGSASSTRLNEVNWRSDSFIAGAEYRF